jgi:hypothetical protein
VIFSSVLADSEELLVNFRSQEYNDRVGSDSEIVSWETCPESSNSLAGKRLHDAVWHTLVG